MTPYYTDEHVTLWHGDALEVLRSLPDGSVDCCVTSPPYYGLRDYGEAGQYGLEKSPAEYVAKLCAVFGEVRRVLADDGTLWLNIGDSYASNGGASGRMAATGLGSPGRAALPRPEAVDPDKHARWLRDWDAPRKGMLGIPWRLALALQAEGWILRNAVIWHKPNAMPESVKDRLACTYEFMFLLVKQPRYWFDLDAIREPHSPNKPWGRLTGFKPGQATGMLRSHPPEWHQTGLTTHREHPGGRNPGDVWTIPTSPFPAAHFAVMAPVLAERCVRAGCKTGGTVLDPFCGVGTTGMVAGRQGRRFVGVDISASTLDLALRTRLRQGALIEEVPS